MDDKGKAIVFLLVFFFVVSYVALEVGEIVYTNIYTEHRTYKRNPHYGKVETIGFGPMAYDGYEDPEYVPVYDLSKLPWPLRESFKASCIVSVVLTLILSFFIASDEKTGTENKGNTPRRDPVAEDTSDPNKEGKGN